MSFLFLCCSLCAIIISGWPLARILGHAEDIFEQCYQSAIIGALIHGGVAVALAALGIFHIAVHIAIVLVQGGAAVWWLMRQQHTLWPSRRERDATNLPIALAMTSILLVTLWLNRTPSEVIFGARDAGIYANTGFMIARTGGIIQHDPVLAAIAQRREHDAGAAQAWSNLLGVQAAERFMSSRMRLAGLFVDEATATSGAYVPQFLHLFPAWIALFSAVYGISYGLLATGLAGALGVWSVGMAARVMHHPWSGVIAMGVLALNAVQVWFSRYPMAETTAQWLFFAAIYGVAKIAHDTPRPDRLSAVIAGAAIGQLMLARLDFVFVVAPVVVWVLWRWVTQRIDTPFRWLLGGFAVTGGHGILHLLTISRGYFIDTFFARLQDTAISALLVFPLLTPRLQQTFLLRPCSPLTAQPCPGESIADAPWQYGRIAGEILLVVIIIATFFWVRQHHQRITQHLPTLWPWYQRTMRIAAVGIVIAAGYAYFIRPQIITPTNLVALPGCVAPAQIRAPQGVCLALQGYVGAPVAPPIYADPVSQRLTALWDALRGRPHELTPLRDLYANSMANLVRVGWYLSPLGIFMAVLGASIVLWQGVNRRNWLFVLVTLGTAMLYIQLSYGTSSQTYIYIMRRYLTNVYPGFAVFIGIFTVTLWSPVWWRKLASVASTALLALFLVITVRPVVAEVELRGAIRSVAHIATLSQPDDITLIRGGSPNYGAARDSIDVLALPLVAIHDQAVFGIRSLTPEKYGRELASLWQTWMDEGRAVFYIAGANGALWMPDMHLVKKEPIAITVPEFSQLLNQKPGTFGRMQISYQRYQIVAGPGRLPDRIDTSDTASQVSGFYPYEQDSTERTYAWTTGDAVIRMPLPTTPTTIAITAAAGTNIANIPAQRLCLAYAGQALPWTEHEVTWQEAGCVALTATSGTYTFTLTDIPPSATDTLLIKLASTPWVPAEVDPLQNDRRTLGFQFEEAAYIP